MRTALVSGFWAQNIGNAFFNIGGKWVLEQVFGSDQVQFVQDQPAYRTFYKQHNGPPKNYARILDLLDVEYVVLQGPMLTTNFKHIWEATFAEYKRRGIKVILLGAAFFKYTKKEIEDVKKFLDQYPPSIISTRDGHTYDILKDWIPFTHNGIDSAFFVPKAFNPIFFDCEYITLNFDRYPEPNIFLNSEQNSCDASFHFCDHKWSLKIPWLQSFFSNQGKAQAYLGHLVDFRKLPKELCGYKIIRPEHRYTPHMTHKIYQHPNSFVSDETFSYFSIYAGTKLTLADRVHACVMTLAYGNPAMLFTPSPRQALFARLGLSDIRKRPVKIDMDYLEEQRQGVLKFLKNTVEILES